MYQVAILVHVSEPQPNCTKNAVSATPCGQAAEARMAQHACSTPTRHELYLIPRDCSNQKEGPAGNLGVAKLALNLCFFQFAGSLRYGSTQPCLERDRAAAQPVLLVLEWIFRAAV